MRLLCTVLAALAVPLASCGRDPSDAEDWVRVRRDDLVLTVDVTGKLAAVDSDVLGPPSIEDKWDYKISMMAPEGSSVKKGDPVLAFDASDLLRTLETKENERAAALKEIEREIGNAQMARRDEELRIAEAEAHLHKARLKLDRPADLSGSIELALARIDLELAEKEVAYQRAKAEQTKKRDAAAIAVLRQKHDRAEARIKHTKAGIAKMSIAAPRAGTVIYPTSWNDQKKKVGDNAWQEEKVIETAALDEMIAKAEVDEVDASKATVGQRVSLRLDALPDLEFWGTVKTIGTTVQRQSRKNPLKVVRMDVVLDRTDAQRMRPGMRFKGAAETERVTKAILVPTSAIFLTEQGPVAYRKTPRGFEAARLELGKRSRDYAEVKSGLGEGDEVSRIDLARAEGR